jgi:hypothetical protein
MKAVKAIYHKGKVRLSEKPREVGPTEVLVVFPEPSDDPWERLLNDSRPRPALARRIKEVLKEIAKGKPKPLDLNRL